MKRKLKHISLLGKISIVSTLVLTLVISPLSWSPVKKADASSRGGLATEPSQIANIGQNTISALENRIQTSFAGTTAGATLGNFIKENVLDGISWTIAKTVLSSMVQSLISWVNSGFQGNPAFITDISQHLLGVLDETAGEFISSLGGIGEFICSPFQLDVQTALATNYEQARSGMPSGPSQNMCSASDIGSNIENFFSGANSSWNDWFQVTSNPQNTPLGAYYAAEASLNARLINEAGQEIQLANWGSGFLSQKVCEAIEGGGGSNCTITTPGRVISEALTFSTSVGPRTLIEADEINELVGALLSQLMVQAMQGVNGLLGLGGNPAYASYDEDGNTYLENMVAEMAGMGIDKINSQTSQQIALEKTFLELIENTLTLATSEIEKLESEKKNLESTLTEAPENNSSFDPTAIQNQIQKINDRLVELAPVLAEANSYEQKTKNNLTSLEKIAETFSLDSLNELNQKERQKAVTDFTDLFSSGTLVSEPIIREQYIRWSKVITNLTLPSFP